MSDNSKLARGIANQTHALGDGCPESGHVCPLYKQVLALLDQKDTEWERVVRGLIKADDTAPFKDAAYPLAQILKRMGVKQ